MSHLEYRRQANQEILGTLFKPIGVLIGALTKRKLTSRILLIAAAVVIAVLAADCATKVGFQPYLEADQFEADQFPSHLRDITKDQTEIFQQQISAGRSDKYAGVYDHAYTSVVEDFSPSPRTAPDWVATKNLPRFAVLYAQQFARGKSATYAVDFAANILDGEGPDYAHAMAHGSGTVPPAYSYIFAEGINPNLERIQARRAALQQATYPAVILAIYSTEKDSDSAKRAGAVHGTITHLAGDEINRDTLLSLLNDVAPEASLDARQKALNKLAALSRQSKDPLTNAQSLQVVNELTRLITSHAIDADQRAQSTAEMAHLIQQGELNPDNAAHLAEKIAPEWSIAERREALGYLAWQLIEGNWDAQSTKRTAEEGYTLITGGQLQPERRLQAGVQLVGEGLKRYGGDNYDPESIDTSVALVQQAIAGDIRTDTVSTILDSTTGTQTNTDNPDLNHHYYRVRDSVEPAAFARYRKIGMHSWTQYFSGANFLDEDGVLPIARIFAKEYAETRVYEGKSPTYARAYADYQAEWNRSSSDSSDANRYALAYERSYRQTVADGRPLMYAEAFARAVAESGMSKGQADAFAQKVTEGLPLTFTAVYSQELLSGRSHVYAYNYADKLATGHSSEYAHAYAQQIDAGHSQKYADAYAKTKAYDFTISIYGQTEGPILMHSLTGEWQGNVSYLPNDVELYAVSFAQQIENGHSGLYSRFYAESAERGHSREYAQAYAGQIVAYKSLVYANAYAGSVENGKSEDYAHAFVYAVESGAFNKQAGKDSRNDEQQAAPWNARYAEAFVEQQEAKGPEYAHIYASMVASGKSSEYAHSFARQLTAGRPQIFSRLLATITDITN